MENIRKSENMKRTPCEYIVWYGLPVLRSEIARIMINDFSLKEKEAAQKLGVTPSAISQYLSGKRGNIDITDTKILYELKITAERIISKGEETVVPEICRLCKFFSSKKLLLTGDKK